MDKHVFTITPTGDVSMSGRPTYRVCCVTCRVLVHEATNAPHIRAAEHREGGSPYERPMQSEAP